MKSIIFVALALVAVVAAAPYDEPEKILRSEYNQDPSGSYSFGFETEKGSSRNEEGQVKEVVDEENKPHNVVVVRGSFSYTDSNGQLENINYYADETGYHPEGLSIPKTARR